MLAYLGEGNIHIIRPGQVSGGAHEGVSLRVEDVEDASDRDEHVIVADHELRLGLAVAPAVPVPEPVTAAAPSVAVVVRLARGPAAGRHGLPVPAAALLAAALTAGAVATTVIPAALLAAALLAAGLVPAALLAAAVVAAGLLAGPLVPAARRLVVTAPGPATPVTALRLARGSLTQLGVLACALRRAARLLGSGLLSGSLLSRCLLSWWLLSRCLLGLAVGPVGHGRLVEAELLPGSVGADPAAGAGAQA